MSLFEQMQVEYPADSLTPERFATLAALGEERVLTAGQIAELASYFVQLGLFFYLDRKQQVGLSTEQIFDAAIALHEQNIEALQKDIDAAK